MLHHRPVKNPVGVRKSSKISTVAYRQHDFVPMHKSGKR
jgi:hypothetical protein